MSTIRFPIEASHILMFARSVGDENLVYTDRATETPMGSVIAPPTFLWAMAQFDPDYPLRPRPGREWIGSAPRSSSPAGSTLHAEQHFEYFRPVRPGDVLTVLSNPGATWEKQSKSGAKLVFAETIVEYRDERGELVCRARKIVVTPQPAAVPGSSS